MQKREYFFQKIINFQKVVIDFIKHCHRYLSTFKPVWDNIWPKFWQISFRFWINMQSNGIKWHKFVRQK